MPATKLGAPEKLPVGMSENDGEVAAVLSTIDARSRSYSSIEDALGEVLPATHPTAVYHTAELELVPALARAFTVDGCGGERGCGCNTSTAVYVAQIWPPQP